MTKLFLDDSLHMGNVYDMLSNEWKSAYKDYMHNRILIESTHIYTYNKEILFKSTFYKYQIGGNGDYVYRK